MAHSFFSAILGCFSLISAQKKNKKCKIYASDTYSMLYFIWISFCHKKTLEKAQTSAESPPSFFRSNRRNRRYFEQLFPLFPHSLWVNTYPAFNVRRIALSVILSCNIDKKSSFSEILSAKHQWHHSCFK